VLPPVARLGRTTRPMWKWELLQTITKIWRGIVTRPLTVPNRSPNRTAARGDLVPHLRRPLTTKAWVRP